MKTAIATYDHFIGTNATDYIINMWLVGHSEGLEYLRSDFRWQSSPIKLNLAAMECYSSHKDATNHIPLT